MTSRSYITERGIPVAVEVGTDADRVEVERELRRIYGNAYRLGRFVRRGKRQRASVEKLNDSKVLRRARNIGMVAENLKNSEVLRTPRKTSLHGQGWLGGVS